MNYIRKFTQSLGLTALLALGGCRFDLDSLRAKDMSTNERNLDGGNDGNSKDLSLRMDLGVNDSAVNHDALMSPDGTSKECDLGKKITDSGTAIDAGLLPDVLVTPDSFSGCYSNDFNEDSDLENLVAQNGVWSRDVEGYLKQIELGGGYRMAYLNNATYSDFDATVKVRVPSGFGGDAHTGMLFRYTRESTVGYDYDIDRGYILEIEEGDGSSFELTLEDAYNARLFYTRVDGAFDTWHNLRVRAIGSSITGYFNGVEIFTLENSLYSSGNVGFGSHASESHFDDLEICEE
ncbi:DUF1080 domain-containing protein [Candidatus Woesearchaeota archaeon]|nr:DUF1080 domain-containing protein [Candidatus Woesearchaeota archaeon]